MKLCALYDVFRNYGSCIRDGVRVSFVTTCDLVPKNSVLCCPSNFNFRRCEVLIRDFPGLCYVTCSNANYFLEKIFSWVSPLGVMSKFLI